MYSPSIDNLIRELKKLPSVGTHTAERFVFHWLNAGKKEVADLQRAVKELMENVRSCEQCFTFSDSSPCATCRSDKRDKTTICVVAIPQDIVALEQTNHYHGLYHVLRGTLESSDPHSLDRLKIAELCHRLTQTAVREVILALSPDLPGETTMLYLIKKIKEIAPQVTVSRLARGLPMGSDIAYADEVTLGSALSHRLVL
jgi:recombination protein RecR